MNRKSLRIGFVALSLIFAGSFAKASILYSDLNSNPGNVYDRLNSFTIEGTATAQFFAQGFSFTPSVSDGLAHVDIALGFFGGTNSAVVTLRADNGGVPGAILETWNVSGLPDHGTCCAVQTLAPAVPINLITATTYWLVASPGAADTDVGWFFNNTSQTGPRAAQSNPAGNFGLFGGIGTLGAFDVIGADTGVPTSGVPEPDSLTLALVGVLLLAARAAWRR